MYYTNHNAYFIHYYYSEKLINHFSIKSMMNASSIGFFRYTEFLQKVCGVGIAQDGTFKIKSRVRLFLFVIYPTFIFYPAEIVMSTYNIKNLSNFIKVIVNTVTHTTIIFKAITYYVHSAQIAYTINILKYQECTVEEIDTILVKHKKLAEKWLKAFLLAGSFICFFMAVSALYIVVFAYQPLGEGDIIFFPDFGNTRFGFALFWLYQILPLSAFLWSSAGKFYN